MKAKPFLFDSNIFEDDHPLSEEESAKKPEFSREDMEAAKLSAFAEGRKEGFQESQESMTNTMLGLLQKIESDVGVLFASEEKRKKDFEQSATHLAAQIFNKAFPVYMEAHGLEELRAAVTESLSSHMMPEEIVVEINDAVFGPFTKLIEEHTDALQKQIDFKSDPALPEYACRISWPGGGLLCDRNALAEKIFNILNHSLAEQGFTIHDGANSKKDAAGDGDVTESDNTEISEGEDTGIAASEGDLPLEEAEQKNKPRETTTSGES